MSASKSATIPNKKISVYKGPGLEQKGKNYSPIKESNEGGSNTKTSKFSSTSKKMQSDDVTEKTETISETDAEEEAKHQAQLALVKKYTGGAKIDPTSSSSYTSPSASIS